MQIKETETAVEALLFASGEPVSLDALAEVLSLSTGEMGEIMTHMMQTYNEQGRGIMLLKLGNNYQLATKKEYSEQIKQLLDTRRSAPLSAASLEVLAIVAYNEPVTRGYISQVRGVDCGEIVEKLTEKGLICECGKLDAPGRPRLFKTTPDFLRVFGLTSLDELPAVDIPNQPAEDGVDGQTDITEVM